MNVEQVTQQVKEVSSSEQNSCIKINNGIHYRRAADIVHQPTYCLTPETEKLIITVAGESLHIMGTIDGKKECFYEECFWGSKDHDIEVSLKKLYSAVKDFREHHSSYLNNIDPTDLLNRLENSNHNHLHNWSNCTDNNQLNHDNIWSQVETSLELRNLAYHGHELYEDFFQKGSKLHKLLNSLNTGTIIEINWLPNPKLKWRSHVPWGLMFQQTVPNQGQPINPLAFLGLRYRIEYIAHNPDGKPEALGSLKQTNRVHYLYWGQGNREIAPEAEWLRATLSSKWPNQEFVPRPDSINHKNDLLNSLEVPTPNPVNLIYFYCVCDVENGNSPVLRFGDNNGSYNIILETEMSQKELQDRPLVFANACATLASSPYMSNSLEKTFFKRGCAAYLGTESEVPIILASRFAIIFFYFFYSQLNLEKVVAGEAVVKTRLFLWQNYKNIGGLFYSYVGPYGLYVDY